MRDTCGLSWGGSHVWFVGPREDHKPYPLPAWGQLVVSWILSPITQGWKVEADCDLLCLFQAPVPAAQPPHPSR